MKLQLFLILCVWGVNYAEGHCSDHKENIDHTRLVQMARYVMHMADWATVTTLSYLPGIRGYPFTTVKSVVDGLKSDSTGVPYFYMSSIDATTKDLKRNANCTIMLSLESKEKVVCEEKKYDAEDPRCNRVVITGRMRRLTLKSAEYKFAKKAVFAKHPALLNLPEDTDFFVAKLKIFEIAIVDAYGSPKFIRVNDYLNYDYPGNEVLLNYLTSSTSLKQDTVNELYLNVTLQNKREPLAFVGKNLTESVLKSDSDDEDI